MATEGLGALRAAALLLALVACDNPPPQRTERTSNKGYDVALLFEHDGCRVYRFMDGTSRYYVQCGGKIGTAWSEYCGRGCTRQVGIDTSESEPPQAREGEVRTP